LEGDKVMIKTIKKIDIYGNEVWQEVIVCNRCKRTLEEDEYVYTTKWTSWFPVKPKGLVATGFSQGSNPNRHICEKCNQAVQDFWEGKDIEEKNKPILTTFEERVALHKESLQCESTPALKEFRNSCMCSVETAAAIDLILKERQL
jgi:hypothetical protein